MKKLILIGVIAICVVAFLMFSKSVCFPILKEVRETETVSSRIKSIQKGVWTRIEGDLKLAGYEYDYPKEVLLVAFKEERILQVYGKSKEAITLIKEYPFTAYSGTLGPKLQEGDRQIPEGVYKVEYLNPNSSYHLSIKVDYPNRFDKSKTKFSDYTEMGGDIFIHGKDLTIGCIPIGDRAIEEVFVLTQKARNKEVKVIISPRDFRINPNYPVIEKIDWENQLYEMIEKELERLPS